MTAPGATLVDRIARIAARIALPGLQLDLVLGYLNHGHALGRRPVGDRGAAGGVGVGVGVGRGGLGLAQEPADGVFLGQDHDDDDDGCEGCVCVFGRMM